jgi:drug/metabolite transporter (DMT)-like permease
MLVTLLIPVTAILLGYLVLGESLKSHEIAGALVIGSALLLIDGRVFGRCGKPGSERLR